MDEKQWGKQRFCRERCKDPVLSISQEKCDLAVLPYCERFEQDYNRKDTFFLPLCHCKTSAGMLYPVLSITFQGRLGLVAER